MRRFDQARLASPRILTWGDLATYAGGWALAGFVGYEVVRAVVRLLVGAWS